MILPDGREIKYQYDDEGNLIARRAYAADDTLLDDERYLVQSSRLSMTAVPEVLASIDGRTKALRSRNSVAQGVFGQMEIKAEPGGGARPEYNFILTDAQGTPAARVGAGPTEHMDYEGAFGRARSAPGEGASAGAGPGGVAGLAGMAYTNRGRDPPTGLQFHYARWLEPGLGLWLSPDPVLDFPNNFGSAYTYVGQDAANRVDRMGLFTLNEQTILSAIVSELVREASFNVGTALLKAGLTAVGVDVELIFGKIFSILMDVFDLHIVLERIVGLAEENADYIEFVMGIVQFVSFLEIAYQGAATLQAIFELFFRRSIRNIIEAAQEIWSFGTLLHNLDYEISLEYNTLYKINCIPGYTDTNHHLISNKRTNSPEGQAWTNTIRRILDNTLRDDLKDLNKPWNIYPVSAKWHYSKHPPRYHEFVLNTLEAVSKPSSVLK